VFGDYGYAEEGRLGKPYNWRILKRLTGYVLPYRKVILAGLLLSILIALFDLTVPYLTKIAIDRYIVASWHRLDLDRPDDPVSLKLKERYASLLEPDRSRSVWYLSNLGMKQIDPSDLHFLRVHGIIGDDRFYRIEPDRDVTRIRESAIRDAIPMADGASLLPYKTLETLSPGDIFHIRGGDIRGVTIIGLLFLCLIVLSLGAGYGEYYLLEWTGQRMMQDIRLDLFDTLQSQSLRFFDRHPVGRLVTRATNDVENLNEMFKSVFVTVFKDIFILIGILAVLLALNWRLALICFILLPVIFVVTLVFSSLAREAFRELRATVAKINAFLQERIRGMQVIQLFGREPFQMEAFARINQENYTAGMRQIRVFALFMPAMELFSSLTVAFLIWHGGGKVVQDELTLGTLVAFIGYIQMFFKPIRDISEKYNIMQLAMASSERIFEFMDVKEMIPSPAVPQKPARPEGHLVFDNVSFAYERGKPVLHDISFEVKPGETLAVVGATGSGKTTIVSLLDRFYDPDKGSILLDGVDLREWPAEELRQTVGLCMQDVFVFSGKLADNIGLGREGVSPEAIRKAAATANALPFIERLPDGFDEQLGEGGSSLSTGERQLLSFARALAGDPRLLVLDEATSSVDPETERLIQEAIFRMAQKRTTLIVAHRLSTVRNADRILVLHHGRIREQGTHEELMILGGIYFKLNRLA